MKIIRNFFFVMAGIYLLMSCSKSEDLFINDQSGANLKCAFENNHHGQYQDRYVTMKTTGLKVHYRVIGKGPIDMVFIPGWTNPLEIFQKQFDFFSDKARCIYIDVPGQGLSDAPEGIDYTMGLMADAIYNVIKKEGVRKFVAVGFSMGPVLLGQFELRHPGMITKLVNLDGDFYPWPSEGDPTRETYATELNGFCDWIETWGTAEKEGFASLLLNESSPSDLIEFVKYFYDFPSWLMANIYRNVMVEEVNKPVGWTFPILCIYSIKPTNMDYIQSYFPDTEMEVMGNTGHVVQWEDPGFVNNRIWKFVCEKPGRKIPRAHL